MLRMRSRVPLRPQAGLVMIHLKFAPVPGAAFTGAGPRRAPTNRDS